MTDRADSPPPASGGADPKGGDVQHEAASADESVLSVRELQGDPRAGDAQTGAAHPINADSGAGLADRGASAATTAQGRSASLGDSADDQATPACGGCGGPHPFDTSVPSVAWNAVIRAQGLSDYLCTTCIVRAFAKARRGFVATLHGDGFNGLRFEVVMDGQAAQDLVPIERQNTELRAALYAIVGQARAALDKATGPPA